VTLPKAGYRLVGANDVQVIDGKVFVVFSSAGPQVPPGLPKDITAALRQQAGRVVRVGPGDATAVANISAVEFGQNPDGSVVDSNPYGLAMAPGYRVATDAAGNSLIGFNPSGATKVLAVFPDNHVGGQSVDCVPTDVVRSGSSYYVSCLGSEIDGNASVWKVPAAGGSPTKVAGNLTAAVGIDVDGKGNLYVAQLFNSWAGPRHR